MSALAVILGADEPQWLLVEDGAVTARGVGVDWPRTDTPMRAMLVVPAAATALHRAALPDLAPRQAAVAARLMATENAIGGADTLHVAVGPRDADGAMDVAVVANVAMAEWLAWAAAQELDATPVVPAALLLPRPAEGFAVGVVGAEEIARDASAAFALDAEIGALVLGDAPVVPVSADAIEAAIVAAFSDPPIDLRGGTFARRQRRGIDWGMIRRCAILAGLILLASLIITSVQIAKLDSDTGRIDAQALAAARRVLPQVSDVTQAESALNGRAASLGVGGRGFGSATARLFAALDQSPAAALTTFETAADGSIHATVSGPQPNDVDIVVAALRGAGAKVDSTPTQAGDGRQGAALTVTTP